ncbi:MAG TPA: hypothetical protein VFW71_03880 [Actinomycetota bacterium]|nr:hypothetical protein [Actinomycetota bacterium]
MRRAVRLIPLVFLLASACQLARSAARAPQASGHPPRSPAAVPSPSPSPPPAPVRIPSPYGAGPSSPTAPPGGVTAIGDSVMLDAAPNLSTLVPGIAIDAMVSRPVATGIAELQRLAASGALGARVVIHLGTNGGLSRAQLDQIVALAAGRHLVLLTNHCPYCSWVAANNAVIRAGCSAARHCTVADWNALADANPQWFGRDGVHMPIGGTGGEAYAEMVVHDL